MSNPSSTTTTKHLDNEILIQQNSISTRIAVLEIMSKNGWSSNISLTQKIDAVSHSLSCTSLEFQKVLFKNLYEAYTRRNGEFYPEKFPVSQMNNPTVIEKEFNQCTESFNQKCLIEPDTVNNSEFVVMAEQVDLLDAEIEMGSPIKNQTKIIPQKSTQILKPVSPKKNLFQKPVEKTPDASLDDLLDWIIKEDIDKVKDENKENENFIQMKRETIEEKEREAELKLLQELKLAPKKPSEKANQEAKDKIKKENEKIEQKALLWITQTQHKLTKRFYGAVTYLVSHTTDERMKDDSKHYLQLVNKIIGDNKDGKKSLKALRTVILELGASENQNRGSDECREGKDLYRRNQRILFKIANLLGNICRGKEEHIQNFVNSGIHVDMITVCESEVNEFRVLQCCIWAFRDICHHGRTKSSMLSTLANGQQEEKIDKFGDPNYYNRKKLDEQISSAKNKKHTGPLDYLKDIVEKPMTQTILMRLVRVCCRVAEKTRFESDDKLFEDDIYSLLMNILNSTIVNYEQLSFIFSMIKNKLKDAVFFKHIMHKCFLHPAGQGNSLKLEKAVNANYQRINVLFQEDKSYIARYTDLVKDFELHERKDSLKFMENLLEACCFKKNLYPELEREVYNLCMKIIDISENSNVLVESLKLLEYVGQMRCEELIPKLPALIKLINSTNLDDQVLYFSLECLVEVSKRDVLRRHLDYSKIFMKCNSILSYRDPADNANWKKTMKKANSVLTSIINFLNNNIESTQFAKKLETVTTAKTQHALGLLCATIEQPKYIDNKSSAKKTWDLVHEIKRLVNEKFGDYDLFLDQEGGSRRKNHNNNGNNNANQNAVDTFSPITLPQTKKRKL